jgi:hypothetical protein
MRAVRTSLITVAVLGGLFTAADRLAVSLAEDRAAEKLRSSAGLVGSPEVSVKGFPFLTQVAMKELDEIRIDLDGATASAGGQSIRLDMMSVRLLGVKLEDTFSSATADRATGTAHIGYEELSKASKQDVTIGYGGRDAAGKSQVKVIAQIPVPLLGRTVERSVVSTVSIVSGDTVRLRAESVPGSEIPGVEEIVRKEIDFDRKIEGLPEGLKLDRVETTESGVEVSVTGRQVVLGG